MYYNKNQAFIYFYTKLGWNAVSYTDYVHSPMLEGEGVNPGKQKKECGGKCLCEPREAPTVLLILPAETRAPCLCTQSWEGRNCLDMPVKILTSSTLYKHTHSPSCVTPFWLLRSLSLHLFSLSSFLLSLPHTLIVYECADTYMSSAWLSIFYQTFFRTC